MQGLVRLCAQASHTIAQKKLTPIKVGVSEGESGERVDRDEPEGAA